MSLENARVFIAEDEEEVIKIIEGALIPEGHQVLIRVTSFESAINAIEEAKEKGINVALIDGSLSGEQPDHTHGLRISQALKAAIPGIKIISISGREVNWADASCCKPFRLNELKETVRGI